MTLSGKALARGALLTFLLRILSFLLSQLTIRLIDPIALGHASIKLELVLNTCLFIGREGFRLTFMKLSNNNDLKVNNVIWLSIPAGILTSILSLTLYLKFYNDHQSYDYKLAGIFYCSSAILETISEPIVILCIRTLDVDTRALAEGIASFIKSMASVLLLSNFISMTKEYPVSSLGFAQFMYSLVLTCIFYIRKWEVVVWPSIGGWDAKAIQSVVLFTFQGLFKHCLTEGDRIVLTLVADGYSQGIFAMVTSYGGIVSRVLLQPIEENARIYFAQKQHTSLEQSYYTLVKLVLYIGCIFACIASNYTYILLSILAGRRWSEGLVNASNALSAFCFYILVMACNGMTEAFVYGIISGSGNKKLDVGRLGLVHGIVGSIFAISAPIFVRYYGTIGLILANGISMLLRSFYSIYFASNHFNNKMFFIVKNIVPHFTVLLTFILSFIITYMSNRQCYIQIFEYEIQVLSKEWCIVALRHIGIGISCVIVLITLFVQYERSFVAELKDVIYSDGGKKNK